MRGSATSVAVVYDSAHSCKLSEPERTDATGPEVTALEVDWSPIEESRYSWLTGYLERLDGKEARLEYYAGLERP